MRILQIFGKGGSAIMRESFEQGFVAEFAFSCRF